MFTPEQQEFLKNLFSEQLAATKQELLTQTNEAISGLAGRIVKTDLPKAIEQRLTPFEQKFANFSEESLGQTIATQFDALLDKIAQEEEQIETEVETQKGRKTKAQQEQETALEQMRQQLESMQQQVELARKAADDREAAMKAAEEKNRITALDDQLLDTLRPIVRQGTERELLTLLKSANVLQEDAENNRFNITVKDKYDLDVVKPAHEAIAAIVAERWPHYQAPRPGTGTGGAPTSQTAIAPASTKYVRPSDAGVTIDQSAIDQAMSSGNFDEVLKELAAI